MPLFSKPKYSTVTVKKKDIPKGLWTKCPVSGEIIFNKELEQNQMVVPKSEYHFPISARKRLSFLLDEESFEEKHADLRPRDPLGFADSVPYMERIKKHQEATGLTDAVVCGNGCIHGIPLAIAVMDFRFMGGAMGSVVGEKITRTFEDAMKAKVPCVVISASGGARMQEGIFSLMQMAKTSATIARFRQAGLPYLSVLTHPTTGGVTASFATLGDLILAEPGALICFAGPRVIRETTNQELPKGFQTAEFLLEHGLVDQIVRRTEMRDRLAVLLAALYLKKKAHS